MARSGHGRSLLWHRDADLSPFPSSHSAFFFCNSRASTAMDLAMATSLAVHLAPAAAWQHQLGRQMLSRPTLYTRAHRHKLHKGGLAHRVSSIRASPISHRVPSHRKIALIRSMHIE